jgi:hypothetical protein
LMQLRCFRWWLPRPCALLPTIAYSIRHRNYTPGTPDRGGRAGGWEGGRKAHRRHAAPAPASTQHLVLGLRSSGQIT